MANARIACTMVALEEKSAIKSAIYIYEKMCSCVVDTSSQPCAPDPDFRCVFVAGGGGGGGLLRTGRLLGTLWCKLSLTSVISLRYSATVS